MRIIATFSGILALTICVLIHESVQAQQVTFEQINGYWESIPGTYGGARGGTDRDEFLNLDRIQRNGNTVLFEIIAIDVLWYLQFEADCTTGRRRLIRRGEVADRIGSDALSEILQSGQTIEIRMQSIDPISYPNTNGVDPTVRNACTATGN